MNKYLGIFISTVLVANMTISVLAEEMDKQDSSLVPEITVDVMEHDSSYINDNNIITNEDETIEAEEQPENGSVEPGEEQTDNKEDNELIGDGEESEEIGDIFENEILTTPNPTEKGNPDIANNDEVTEENNEDVSALSLGKPEADTWTSLAGMTEGRANVDYIIAGGELYIIGGTGENGYLCTIEKYNSVNDTWQSITAIPGEPKGFAVTATDTDIYIVGGYENKEYSNKVRVYNIISGEWSESAPMREQRDRAAAFCMDNKLYVFGGRNQYGFVDSYEFYDFTESTWSKVTTGFAESIIRVGAKARYVDGFVCLYGGIGKDYAYEGVNLYNASDLEVEQEVLPAGYKQVYIAWGANKALVFAGNDYISSKQELTIENNSYFLVDVNVNTSPSAGVYSQYIIYDGYLHCIGGYTSSGYKNNFSKYSVYYGDYSSGEGTIESEVTNGGNQVTLNVEAGTEYMLFINVKNIATFSGYTFTVEYPSNSFEVIDGCAMTAEKNIKNGAVSDADISITELKSNGMSFVCTEVLSGEDAVTKGVNAVLLKANSSGQRTIKYSMTTE